MYGCDAGTEGVGVPDCILKGSLEQSAGLPALSSGVGAA